MIYSDVFHAKEQLKRDIENLYADFSTISKNAEVIELKKRSNDIKKEFNNIIEQYEQYVVGTYEMQKVTKELNLEQYLQARAAIIDYMVKENEITVEEAESEYTKDLFEYDGIIPLAFTTDENEEIGIEVKYNFNNLHLTTIVAPVDILEATPEKTKIEDLKDNIVEDGIYDVDMLDGMSFDALVSDFDVETGEWTGIPYEPEME